MEYPKFYIGPMSKNVVDSILEFTEETDNKIGFIPSRRQVEFNGGYVNNWTTQEFAKYVNGRVLIERDHGGAGQGYKDDDGYKSFRYDSENFDIIPEIVFKTTKLNNIKDIIEVPYTFDTIVHGKTKRKLKTYLDFLLTLIKLRLS